ncbi:MAG TPA: hypothetical protein VJ731_15430 [Terriglobales bacterium]|nr:hypothetical protein [Terriglobales bacterium]
MGLHLLEADDVHDPFFDPSHRGGFALFGRWQGQELVLDDAGEASVLFRTGFKIEQASVRLAGGTRSEFNKACDTKPDP